VLVFGVILVIMMNLRPDGLIPRKKWERATLEKERK
jgi:ABC-type branched-subunit amino acid transport system permease subunit